MAKTMQETTRTTSHTWRTAWWLVADLFAIVMIVYLILWKVTEDRFWPVVALSYVAPLVVPLAVIPLPLAFLRVRVRSVVLELICAVGAVLLIREVYVSGAPPTAPAGAPQITALTYNLGEGKASSEELFPYLREANADLVGLVEVTAETAAALPQLTDLYPYQEAKGLGIPGLALLSRFPISNVTWHEYNPGRPDLQATIDVNGVPVTVFVAHPPPPALTLTGITPRPGTANEIDQLVASFNAIDGPLLVLGDFNVTMLHETYRRIEDTGLQDAFAEAGHGFGFTAVVRLARPSKPAWLIERIRLPAFMRIDYIWASPEWVVTDAWVGDDAGSDHLPVIAKLALSG